MAGQVPAQGSRGVDLRGIAQDLGSTSPGRGNSAGCSGGCWGGPRGCEPGLTMASPVLAGTAAPGAPLGLADDWSPGLWQESCLGATTKGPQLVLPSPLPQQLALLCPQGHGGVPTTCTPRCCRATDTQSPHRFQVVYSRSTTGTGLIAHPGIRPSQVNSAPRCLCCSRVSGAPGEDSGGEARTDTPPRLSLSPSQRS